MFLRRTDAALAFAVVLALLTRASAGADGIEASAFKDGFIDPAAAAAQRLQAETDAGQSVAQAQPIGVPQRPLSRPGLPLGLFYTLDFSMTFPYGDPGYNAGLPGGIDAVLAYGFTPNFRFQVGYYELPEAPIGFSGSTVPLYLQGLASPIGTTRLATDPTIKNKIFTVVDQNLFSIGKVPIVISPSYLARWGTVGGHDDLLQIEYNGFPTTVHLRTYQQYVLGLTLPLLSTPRLFSTYTIAPEWLVHPAGVNQTNHAQLFQLFFLEYRASKQTTFFFQPSLLIDYLPSDPYPEHIPTWILGTSYKFTKYTFVQLFSIWGGATNRSPYGFTAVTCQSIPCTNVAPSLGGLHAAEVQLQFGIGTPSVIPL